MTPDPIYLFDFRNSQVVELEPTTDVDHVDKSKTSEPSKSSVTFAALGSPIENKD